MLEERSEYYPMTLTMDSLDAVKAKRYSNPPLGRRFEANALLANEIHAIMGAQLTQVCQPVLLGKIPSEWQSVIELQREVYEAGLALIKPGTTFGQLADFVNGFGAQRGMKTAMQLHGCGYGDDGPLFNRRFDGKRAGDLRIEAGNAFIWKPIAMTADERIQFSSGGAVIVHETGCESLFTQDHGLVTIV